MKNKSSLSGEISRLKEENVRLVQENDILKNQLSAINRRIAKLKQEIKDWQQAADGLARMIEEIKEKERGSRRHK